MFKFLRSKKGYTLVELMIVLVLLTLGAVALINFFSVAYTSFNKSEERYIKQEAVKQVATLLQTGSGSVSSAQTADIFGSIAVVPTGNIADDSYSYLFAEEVEDEDGNLEGYIISVLNKGDIRANAKALSDVPIYMTIKAYKDKNTLNQTQIYSGVSVVLAALEEDYDYSSGVAPVSDEMFYSLDVAYHFPNMATKEGTTATVNYIAYNASTDSGERAYANTYNESGVVPNASLATVDTDGVVLRVYCDSIVSTDNTEAAISVPSMCFVATASYGLESGQVGQLCEFRDNTLMKSELGKAFVKAYYEISPPIADAIRDSEPLKAAVRTGLTPVMVVAEYANNEDIRTEGIFFFTAFMICGIAVSAYAVKKNQDKRRKRRHKS